MAVFDLFSKRQKRLRGDVPDVFLYDELPYPLRVQLVQVIHSALANDGWTNQTYEDVRDILCREYGVFHLTNDLNAVPKEEVSRFILYEKDVEKVIDAVELTLRAIDTDEMREHARFVAIVPPDDVLLEVNERFREHGVGYEYISREMIRIDSQLIHSEVVKPTLTLLVNVAYQGANEEFRKAHEHYRHGNYKECLSECLKAFESTLKTICDARSWARDSNATAKQLLDICFTNGLFAAFMQSHLGNLRAVLESGVPAIRNKTSGHGQGSTITTVSEETARYMLHLTATNILFFVESANKLP
jgi:hypothetical protein